ncbi:hypothetical protein K432DRAFT_377334 [Lepidopterella palustris CBS 459.81]|uniref:BZIP domain-containing protein n=1 Tax=Lepidopterella palustris CBS 459.81 TaxID=1314670 RepID=A0A8E2EKW7_9PEZI|nr:hypothetical protein K432DRAFT_377334 [Lepidopterella palustris CBS 459.81]
MEDLNSLSMSMSMSRGSPTPETTISSTSSNETKAAAKKRKSWGQVLPEPKTNLPPRKRAKTEDEKEQRRIERVKRNRLAAHNSRERKRQEVEQLQSEKEEMERKMKAMRDQMERMAAELRAYRARHPNETQSLDSTVSTSIEDVDLLQSETICPRQTSWPSPESMDSMDTPRDDSCQPSTPAYSETNVTEPDQTRYPAAILCDLQCQSASKRLSTTSQSTFQLSMAFLILFNLQISLMRSLSTIISTSANSLTRPSLSWWTPRRTSSTRHSSRRTPSPTHMAFVTNLVRNTSICRQTQAQQILLATRLASQLKFSTRTASRPDGLGGKPALERDERRRLARRQRLRLSRSSNRQGNLSLKQEIKWSCAEMVNFTRNPHGRRKYHKRL